MFNILAFFKNITGRNILLIRIFYLQMPYNHIVHRAIYAKSTNALFQLTTTKPIYEYICAITIYPTIPLPPLTNRNSPRPILISNRALEPF